MAKKDHTGAGTPAYTRPLTPAERAEFERDIIEQEKHIELSPEEKAKLEIEKRALLAELSQDTAVAKAAGPKIEARPRRAEQPVVVRDPRPLAEEPETIDASSPLTLAVRARKIQERVVASAQLGRSEIEVQKRATVERLQPLVEKAKETLAAVKALFKQHEETLTTLAPLGWADAPSEWPAGLRLRAQAKVFVPAGRILGQFTSMLHGIPKTIAEAESVMRVGYDRNSSWPSTVTQIEWETGQLARTGDFITSLTADLQMLEQELERIDGQAAGYQGAKQPVVEILLTGDERIARATEGVKFGDPAELTRDAERGPQQMYGIGMNRPLP